MNFRDIVENNRPDVVPKQDKIKEICDFVIAEAKEAIIVQARKHPKDGTPLKIDGLIYLGTCRDEFMKYIIDYSSSESKSFWSGKKTTYTTYSLSSNGEALLKAMQSAASKDGFTITEYKIGFGDTARSDNDPVDGYVRGVRLTYLYKDHQHLLPATLQYKDFDSWSYVRSPDTHDVYKQYFDHRTPGLYVRYQYPG